MFPFGSLMTLMVYYARFPGPFKHFCSVVNGKYWVAEAGYLLFTSGWILLEQPHTKPVALLVYDVRIFAGGDSDRNKPLIAIPVRWNVQSSEGKRIACSHSSDWAVWRSLVRWKAGRLRPHQCLNTVSVGFLNTYPRSGSKDRRQLKG